MNLWDALRNSGKVIKEGLITPNKFNEPAATRFKQSAFPMLGVPGAVAETADELHKGNPGMASLAALGAIPGGMMIGKGAKVWNAIAAEEAARLLRKGIDPHMTTGVHQGVDDILRQEIPDNMAKFREGALERLGTVDEMSLQELIDHPELFKAYPDVGNLSVSSVRGMNSSYNPEWDSIELGRDTLDPFSTMLHEIQHKIQQTEGWAKGGSPTSFKEKYVSVPSKDPRQSLFEILTPHQQYKRLAGEVEARNTQSRQLLDAMARRREHPYSTMDMEIADQTVWGVGDNTEAIINELRKNK